jgi:hypothetical protein
MTRLTLVAAAAAVGIGFAAQTASAHPPVVVGRPLIVTYPTYPVPSYYPPLATYPTYPLVPRIDHDYVVLYRPSILGGWVSYGRFETFRGAQIAERRLGLQGVPSRIVRVRDYNGVFPW